MGDRSVWFGVVALLLFLALLYIWLGPGKTSPYNVYVAVFFLIALLVGVIGYLVTQPSSDTAHLIV